MRETGLIVVSTVRGSLFQLSLQEGHLIEKEIKRPCEHDYLYLLCVQVAGREYLALAWFLCKNIKLMNLNKQMVNSSVSQEMRDEVITAFSGEKVGHMRHGEQNRLFVQLKSKHVLELDTSSTTFIKVKTIINDRGYHFCYVPDPFRLIIVLFENEVRAVSCDDNKTIWKVHGDDDLDVGYLLYAPSHESISVSDWSMNRVVILSLIDGSQLQSIQLPDYVYNIRGLCVYNDQIIVRSESRISNFSLL